MASIIINELDRSVFLNRELTNNNIVLVTGSHMPSGTWKGGVFTPDETDTSAPANKFVLCRSVEEFRSNFGSYPLTDNVGTDNVGWEYAINIIKSGLPVLYYSYYKGIVVSEANLARAVNIAEDDIKLLYDKIYYKLKFIPLIYDNNPNQVDLLLLSDTRKDCITFVDYNEGTADPSDNKYTPLLAEAITGYSRAVVASPAATYISPITNNINPKTQVAMKLTMPPSFWILKTIAEGVANGTPVYSTWAGAKRGRITGVQEFTSKVSSQVMDEWTESLSIIPLMNIPPYGDVIYGNSTRLNVGTIGEDGTIETPSTRSALDSLNVISTINEITYQIFEICLGLRFDTNDTILWNEFRMKLGNVLDVMKSNRAINNYLIVMDNTIVTNDQVDALTVPGIVMVDVGRAAEKFRIEFSITPSGAIFANL